MELEDGLECDYFYDKSECQVPDLGALRLGEKAYRGSQGSLHKFHRISRAQASGKNLSTKSSLTTIPRLDRKDPCPPRGRAGDLYGPGFANTPKPL